LQVELVTMLGNAAVAAAAAAAAACV
jgi:hypothetical protein